jgi:hypothetical protein
MGRFTMGVREAKRQRQRERFRHLGNVAHNQPHGRKLYGGLDTHSAAIEVGL